MQKKLLILGAGIYQVPLIKKAKDMGLYTIAASYAGNYPGFAIADEIWEIDTTDYLQLCAKAKEAGIDGVCTTGTDVSVISVGYLCKELGLCGIPYASASLATNKAQMKEAFLRNGVSTPYAYKVFSPEEALEAFHKIAAPAIVKAVDSSGSRGINRADNEAEILDAYQKAMAVTNKDYVLVETFITAPEIGVDGLISHGEIQLILPHQKFTHTTNTTTLPEGHHFPYHCSPALHDIILAETSRAIHALGLDNCAFNSDVLVTEDAAYILEMGGRAGATCIPELISIYTGLDYYEFLIKMALGEDIQISADSIQHDPCMAKLLFSSINGTIEHIDFQTLQAMQSDTVSFSLDYSEGDAVEAVANGTSRIGQVIMKTDSLGELDEMMDQVRETITINGENLRRLWVK